MKEYNLDIYFDENLHDRPQNENDMDLYVQEKKIALSTIQNPVERVKALGEIGTYLRILGYLGEARDYLLKSLEIIERHNLGEAWKITQQIRLAHVYQWQSCFDLSNPMFDDLMALAQSRDLGHLNDFIWQHAGKNYFDQMKWAQAKACFEKALVLREARNASEDLLESARQSVQATLQRMN